jgi:tetratricopeptide (TPR) repeat protein
MTGPQSQQLFNQALAFHRAGQLADAERFYLQRLAIDPASFAANHMLGVLRFQQGRNGEALELIGAALKAKPGNARILLDYANVQFALGRQKEALESYDKVLAIKPDYAEAHYNLGLSLWGLKRFEEALVSYDRALAIKPDYVEAQYNRGITLQDLKRLREALASYDRVLAIRPDHVGALINRGNVLFDGNHFEEALASYDKALKIDPNNADALNGRGNGLGNLKRFDEALASFDRALAVEPGHPGAFSGSPMKFRPTLLHEPPSSRHSCCSVTATTPHCNANVRNTISTIEFRFGRHHYGMGRRIAAPARFESLICLPIFASIRWRFKWRNCSNAMTARALNGREYPWAMMTAAPYAPELSRPLMVFMICDRKAMPRRQTFSKILNWISSSI